MSDSLRGRRPHRPPSPRSRRARRSPLRLTDWGHSVAALALTLLALGSWSFVARDEASLDPAGLRAGVADRIEDGAVGDGAAGDDAEPAPPRSFSIAAGGDVLIHGPVAARAAATAQGGSYDFAPMFRHVAPLIQEADLGICHMETPVSGDNSDISSYPSFNAPREIAVALAGAGFDLCSTASNHSYDQGAEGVRTTLRVLRTAGLRAEGTAGNPREGERPELLEVNGVTIGHLSYTYGLNGLTLPAGEGYLVDLLDVREILSDARRAKGMGAEFVVVSLQWGQEFQSEVTPEQMSGARKLLRSKNVDLILGHHTHVPQAIKRFGKEFAIFGMGNLISNQRPGATATCCLPETQDGLLVRVEVDEAEDGWKASISFWPTWVRPGTFEVLPVGRALEDPAFAAERAALQESWDRTLATVRSLAGDKAGIRPAD
jgi:poly-gamma-glutamate capsule biosynthesis protein CapA/YwtB (metallophosphatase superfamily)